MSNIGSRDSYLMVEMDKNDPLGTIAVLIDQIPKACEQHKLYKVVFDISQSNVDLSISNRYELGVQAAEKWGYKIQVAIVARARVINRMGETVIANRGGRVRIFSDHVAALEWLGVGDRESSA